MCVGIQRVLLFMDYNPVNLSFFFHRQCHSCKFSLLGTSAFVIPLQFITILLCCLRAISVWVFVLRVTTPMCTNWVWFGLAFFLKSVFALMTLRSCVNSIKQSHLSFLSPIPK